MTETLAGWIQLIIREATSVYSYDTRLQKALNYLNGVKLDITLKRSSPKFCHMSDEDMPLTSDTKIVIEDAFLRLYKLKINPGVLVGYNHMIKKVTMLSIHI
jgi:hypothetical protein